MNEIENGPIKVGRVNIDVEKALGLVLTSDVSVYIGEEALNDLASRHPENYLSILEEMAKILKTPDFVASDAKQTHLAYLRFYCRGSEFRKAFLFLTYEGTPAHWWVQRLSGNEKEDLSLFADGEGFVRPAKKNAGKSRLN